MARYTRQRPSFLNRVQKFLNWGPIEALLIQGFGKKADATGILSYPALKMFKILILQLWYALSDRELDEKLFALVSKSIKSNWFTGNKGAIIDSTIVLSSRRPLKVINIDHNFPTISYSGDEDAKWTVKSDLAYYGYKIHMITDMEHGFIT